MQMLNVTSWPSWGETACAVMIFLSFIKWQTEFNWIIYAGNEATGNRGTV